MRFDRLFLCGSFLVCAVLALVPPAVQAAVPEIPGVPGGLSHPLFLTPMAILGATLLWARGLRRRALRAEADAGAAAVLVGELELRLEQDRVTGLISQAVFRERLQQACMDRSPDLSTVLLEIEIQSRSPGQGFALVVGEEVLLAGAADLLRHALDNLPVQTSLTRTTGRRFLVLATGRVEHDIARAAAEAVADCFRRPLRTDAGAVQLSPLIGYASADAGVPAADVVRRAGLACAGAAMDHRSRAVGFDPVMGARQDRAEAIGAVLAEAIAAGDCLPHYQPQFSLASGQVFGLEALARWYHTGLGWIAPDEFVPIAESTGDIVPLGWNILETACGQIRFLPETLFLSVNLSLSQLAGGDVAATLEDCLATSGLAPDRLMLEVSETVSTSDLKRARASLSQLRDLGVRLALDDFGAGHASLAHVTDFEWDEIKIDRSLTARMMSEERVRAMLALVRKTARDLGAEVLVEGIETVDQRDALMDLGFDRGQGYLFGGPMAIDDIASLFFPAVHRPDRAGTEGVYRGVRTA